MSVIIFASPFDIGIVFFGMVDHAHIIDVSINFSIGEISSKMRISERIIVREWHLAYVVAINEWFLRLMGWGISSSHLNKINYNKDSFNLHSFIN